MQAQGTLYAILLIAILGYYFNRNGKQSRKLNVYRHDIANEEKPSVPNMYSSTQKWDVDNFMYNLSDKRYKQAEDPNGTGVIPPLYNERTNEFERPRFTEGGGISAANSGEAGFGGYEGYENVTSPVNRGGLDPAMSNAAGHVSASNEGLENGTPLAGREAGMEAFTIHGPQYSGPGDVPYTLTENPGDETFGPYSNSVLLSGRACLNEMGYGPTEIKKSVNVASSFGHNNMVPFFGSASKQSMDPYAHQTKLEHFTGVNKVEGNNKHEVPSFGDIAPTVSHVNGTPAYRENHDRYVTSSLRTNLLPFQQIKVAPGVNQGYDAIGTDGFHPSYRPQYRTVDELRVNQKDTYGGRVIHSGIQGRARGNIGRVVKYRPETDFKLGEERWFTAPSADALAPKARENYDQLRCTSRSTTTDAYVGGPGNAGVTQTYVGVEYEGYAD